MRCLFAVCLFALAAMFVPQATQAQEAVVLPELAPLASLRDQFVQTFNGRPLQVCQSEWQTWNRMHGVCHELADAALPGQQLTAGRVVEFVVYDGTRYERVGTASEWTAAADPLFDPDLTLREALFGVSYDAALTRLGSVELDGLTTQQYQYWLRDQDLNQAAGGQAVYDLFVSVEGYVLKSQFSSRGTIPGLGQGELAEIWSYRDFNAPIVVVPPS